MVSETTVPPKWPQLIAELQEIIGRLDAFGGRVAHRTRTDINAGEKDIHAEVLPSNDVFQKWTLEILYVIGCNPGIRFNELQRFLGGISSRTLSNKLADLETRGYVARNVVSGRPPRVEYAVTSEGHVLSRLTVPLVVYLASQRRRARAKPPTPA